MATPIRSLGNHKALTSAFLYIGLARGEDANSRHGSKSPSEIVRKSPGGMPIPTTHLLPHDDLSGGIRTRL